MTVQVIRLIGTEGELSTDTPTLTTKWLVSGTTFFQVAVSALSAEVPPYIIQPAPFGVLQTLNYNSIHMVDQGGGIWNANVVYSRYKARDPGTASVAFDLMGQSVKVTHGYAQTYYPGPNPNYNPSAPTTPTNFPTLPPIPFYNAMGVDNTDGIIKVNGIEDFQPNFSFKITRVFGGLDNPLDSAYINVINSLTNCVNEDTVDINVQDFQQTCAPGELWFEGATGEEGTDRHSEIVLSFGIHANLSNFIVANTIKVAFKAGWDQLEVYYEQGLDINSYRLSPVPRQVNITQKKVYAPLTPLLY